MNEVVVTIRDALKKVAVGMSGQEIAGQLPLGILFQRGIVSKPEHIETIYPDCALAAALATSETRLLPVPIEIYFDQFKRRAGGEWNVHRNTFVFRQITR